MIEYGGGLEVVKLGEGKVRVGVVKGYYGGGVIGNGVWRMGEDMGDMDSGVGGILGEDGGIGGEGWRIVEGGDEVLFIGG